VPVGQSNQISLMFMIGVVKNGSYLYFDVKCVEIVLPFKISASINKLVVIKLKLGIKY
jgi:hypothetical protein